MQRNYRIEVDEQGMEGIDFIGEMGFLRVKVTGDGPDARATLRAVLLKEGDSFESAIELYNRQRSQAEGASTIDVPTTGLQSGSYRLIITINGDGAREETSLLDNKIEIDLQLRDKPLPPEISIDDAQPVMEGGVATFKIQTAEHIEDRWIDVLTVQGGRPNDSDYVPIDERIFIPAGQRDAVIEIQTLPDGLSEGSENFGVVITNSTHGRVADRYGHGVIRDPQEAEPEPEPMDESPELYRFENGQTVDQAIAHFNTLQGPSLIKALIDYKLLTAKQVAEDAIDFAATHVEFLGANVTFRQAIIFDFANGLRETFEISATPLFQEIDGSEARGVLKRILLAEGLGIASDMLQFGGDLKEFKGSVETNGLTLSAYTELAESLGLTTTAIVGTAAIGAFATIAGLPVLGVVVATSAAGIVLGTIRNELDTSNVLQKAIDASRPEDDDRLTGAGSTLESHEKPLFDYSPAPVIRGSDASTTPPEPTPPETLILNDDVDLPAPPTDVSIGGFRDPVGDGTVTATRFDNDSSQESDGFAGWYDAQGLYDTSTHLGVDWNSDLGGDNDVGFPVFAAFQGVVIGVVNPKYDPPFSNEELNSHWWRGQSVLIQHDLPNGEVIVSHYAHLQNADETMVGQFVATGDIIGEIAPYPDNSRFTAAHLHFEIRGADDPAYPIEMGQGPAYRSGLIPQKDEFGVSYVKDGNTRYYDPIEFINARRIDPKGSIEGGGGDQIVEPTQVEVPVQPIAVLLSEQPVESPVEPPVVPPVAANQPSQEADMMSGSSGDETMSGLAGDDTMRAGGGDDTVLGGDGDDRMLGQGGNDRLVGQAGNDFVKGNGGDDFLKGGGGDDTLTGGGGDDSLRGNGGDDNLKGGGGADNLKGGGGNDTIFGNGSADDIKGGRGDDVINAGRGDDTINGNGGSDTIQFRTGDGSDAINGFQQDQDLIEILAGATGFDDLDISQDGGDVLIEFANVDITVINARTGQFTEDDFIF